MENGQLQCLLTHAAFFQIVIQNSLENSISRRHKMSDTVTSHVSESPEWAMLLENLEQMHPQYLGQLLENRKLKAVLDQMVINYVRTVVALRERLPQATEEQRVEMAQSELLPINPNWQEEKPLSDRQKTLLEVFKEEHGIE